MAQPNPVTALPGTGAKAVTASDTAYFPPSTIYVGGAGVVNVMPADGFGPVQITVPAGGTVPCLCTQVYNTSTTATLIVRVS